jgi:2-hydroxy-6-oxo-6-(2'-carboxyphenyl)-hexa-2,4-dienoate hydrolase
MRLRSTGFAALLLIASEGAWSASCDIDVSRMERGERRPALLCGGGIAADARIEGLAQAGIEVEYQQYLRRCSVERAGPGLYLWLRAGAGAVTATLRLKAPDGSDYCQPLPIEVSPRRLVETVSFKPAKREGPGVYRLELRDPGLANACAAGLAFPRESWMPALSLVEGSPAECDRRGISALVRLQGEQRFASAVLVGDDAVAWVQPPPPAWAGDMPAEEARFIDVDGIRTRYFDSGRGNDAIILIHGGQPDPISPTAETWRANFRALSREFRVIAYDVLGSGYTNGPQDEAGYGEFYPRVVEHLHGLIRALDLRRVHLVGSSQGGWPVLRMALDHPELVRCAVSVDSVMAPFTRDSGGLRVFAYMLVHVHPASGPTPQSLLRDQRLMTASWNNVGFGEAAERLGFAALPKLAEAKAEMARAAMSPGHPAFRQMREQALAEVKDGRMLVPHLVIWGSADPVASLAQGVEFYRVASAGPAPTQFTVIGAAGHLPQVEDPAAFNSVVSGFCGRYREP